MSIKSALIISGAILAAALGIYWIAAPREACPEELYRQYMQLSPFEQWLKEKLGDKINDILIYFSVFISLLLGMGLFFVLPD